VQAGYKAQPLSAYLKQPAPPPAPKIDFLPATTAGIKGNFFDYLDAALKFVPPAPEAKDIRDKLARIGVGPGKTFEFKDLSEAHKGAVMLGMKEGDDKIDKYLATGLKDVNGWTIASPFGDRSFYKGNWLLRAASAKVAADPAVVQVIERAGSPLAYLDAPEFQTYWNADANTMTDAVRKIGKVE